jgi:hypothetical protein
MEADKLFYIVFIILFIWIVLNFNPYNTVNNLPCKKPEKIIVNQNELDSYLDRYSFDQIYVYVDRNLEKMKNRLSEYRAKNSQE